MASKDQGPSQSLSAGGLKKFRKEKNGIHFPEKNVCYRCVKVSTNVNLSYRKGEIQAVVFFSLLSSPPAPVVVFKLAVANTW